MKRLLFIIIKFLNENWNEINYLFQAVPIPVFKITVSPIYGGWKQPKV